MNILLVGAEAASLRVMRAIEATPHHLAGVVTDDAQVSQAAARADIPTEQGVALDDPGFPGFLCDREIDILLNVHSRRIVAPGVLDASRVGSFNLHPGPLPEYAGLNAPSWAIFHGRSTHGVTLHWMEVEVDTGPVAYATVFPITQQDTGLSVSARCVLEGVPLIEKLLDRAAADPASIPAVPQDHRERQWYGGGAPNAGRLQWTWPARVVVDFVRACDYRPFRSPWGAPRAALAARELRVLEASRTFEATESIPGTVGDIRGGGALVAVADEWVLLRRVSVDESAMDASEALGSGDILEDGL